MKIGVMSMSPAGVGSDHGAVFQQWIDFAVMRTGSATGRSGRQSTHFASKHELSEEVVASTRRIAEEVMPHFADEESPTSQVIAQASLS